MDRAPAAIAIGLFAVLIGCATVPPAPPDYPQTQAQRVEIGGFSVHYFDLAGESAGMPVVWIHGYSGTGFETTFLCPHLGDACRIIAPDLPGFGLSDKPPVEYTGELYAEFLTEFIDGLGLGRYVLAGHSMGGLFASRYAASAPEGLQALILVAPYLLPGQAGPVMEFLTNSATVVDLGMELHNQAIIELAVRIQVFHDHARIPRSLVDYFASATFGTPGARKALASVTHHIIGQLDEPTHLASISVPTLLIWGSDDRVLDVDAAPAIADLVGNSRLVVIPECGHMPHVERAEETARAILEFLRSEGLDRGATLSGSRR